MGKGIKPRISRSTEADITEALNVEVEAFGADEGPVIADLVTRLLNDPTAMPLLSLLARYNDQAVGHILFTKVHINSTDDSTSAAILAPLAVLPSAQSQGIGRALIEEGLRRLSNSGVDLVFVLGYPDYYSRHGFRPAGALGFQAPYSIAEKNADAWMVQELRPGVIGRASGTVICADALDRPEYWRE